MKILIFESNLMWSTRLVKTAQVLGHEAVLRSNMPDSTEDAQVAVVNLGDRGLEPKALVARLKQLGIPVIAHAGHKEKDLLALGKEAGVDILASNSQLTFKLADLLQQVEIPEP
jgi:hypothetical protein